MNPLTPLEALASSALAAWDGTVKRIPYSFKKRLGFRDRTVEAEAELKHVLETWERGDRALRVQLQGKAMAALSYLPTGRLIGIAADTRFDWLKARAVEVLTRRPLLLEQVARLWSIVGDHKANRELVAARAARGLVGRKPPQDFPIDLLEAAASLNENIRQKALQAISSINARKSRKAAGAR